MSKKDNKSKLNKLDKSKNNTASCNCNENDDTNTNCECHKDDCKSCKDNDNSKDLF